MAEATVLVVEDEDKIASVLCDYLQHAGYAAHRLARGDEVLPWLAAQHADLLLLDLMLPGMGGLEVCQAMQQAPMHGGTVPAVIMVTARVEEIDRLLGLEAGADDYICKPFSPREVIARVKAVLRRSAKVAIEPTANALRLDRDAGRAWLVGQDLGLTLVELNLLATLMAQPGRIYPRDKLMDAMYPDDRAVVDRTVDSHVKKLRRKIQEVRPDAELIHSVYGMGYTYEP